MLRNGMINSPIFSRRGAQQAVFSCLFFGRTDLEFGSHEDFISQQKGESYWSPRQQNEQWVKMSSDFGQFSSHFNEIETAHHSTAEVGFAAVQLHCETQMGRHPEAARFAPPSTNPYHFSLEKAGPRKAGENPSRFQQFSVVSKSQN